MYITFNKLSNGACGPSLFSFLFLFLSQNSEGICGHLELSWSKINTVRFWNQVLNKENEHIYHTQEHGNGDMWSNFCDKVLVVSKKTKRKHMSLIPCFASFKLAYAEDKGGTYMLWQKSSRLRVVDIL